jgi:hypothetical protein
MKIRITALTASLLVTGAAAQAFAQTKPAPAKPAAKAAAPKAKESIEATFARQTLDQVLDAVNNGWFGQAYKDVKAVDLEGTLAINFSASAANAKVEQLGQGAVKGGLTKGGAVNMRLKGTYFANADFRTELNGDFGTLLYYRSGNKGFLYSKEMNAYTTKVDPPPADAPVSFLGWFSQCVNEIRDVYVKGSLFRASMGREDGQGGQILNFNAPTSSYDPKKREQSMTESLGFWKRGKLEVVFDKATKLPQRMNYSNDSQGITTHMTFHYSGSRPTSVTIENQSRGMEGPASLTLSYNGEGRIDHLAGQMGFPMGTMRFDLNLGWAVDRKASSIATIPPLGATKKGGEELETMLLVNLAGKVLDLQRGGFNLRSVTLTNK